MEKGLIKGTACDIKVKERCFTVALIVLTIGILVYILRIADNSTLLREQGGLVPALIHCLFGKTLWGSPFGGYIYATHYLLPAVAIAIIILVARAWLGSMTIFVTNKRVFGTTAFGKHVDVPLETISVVALDFLRGITIATTGGKITFRMIPNNVEIYSILSGLLLEQQAGRSPQNDSSSNNTEKGVK